MDWLLTEDIRDEALEERRACVWEGTDSTGQLHRWPHHQKPVVFCFPVYLVFEISVLTHREG